MIHITRKSKQWFLRLLILLSACHENTSETDQVRIDDHGLQDDDKSPNAVSCYARENFSDAPAVKADKTLAPVGEKVTLSPNSDSFPPRSADSYVVLSGLRIETTLWTSSEIQFTVPENGVSGALYLRFSNDEIGIVSNDFRIERTLAEERRPRGLQLTDNGINGVSVFVETDNDYLYSVTGSNTLTTYKLCTGVEDEKICPPPTGVIYYDNGYRVMSRIYFPQRLSDMKIFGECLFVAGSFGLKVYALEELRTAPEPKPLVAIAGNAFYAVDVKEKQNKTLVALSQHLPSNENGSLHIYLYRFDEQRGEMQKEWEYPLPPCHSCRKERLFGIAIDSSYNKVYLGRAAWNLFGVVSGKIDEIVYGNREQSPLPYLNASLEYGGLKIPGMLEAIHGTEEEFGRLWAGTMYMGPGSKESFKVYDTSPFEPPALREIVQMRNDIIHADRFAILDDETTVAISFTIGKPDLGFLNTQGTCTCDTPPCSCLLTDYSGDAAAYDWPHDVTIIPEFPGRDKYDGRIILSDEWGGILTYPYVNGIPPSFSEDDFATAPAQCRTVGFWWSRARVCEPSLRKFDPEYHIPIGGDGAPAIHLTEERVYVGVRGGGLWSADRDELDNGNKWKWVPWKWEYDGSEEQPQPHPVTGVKTRKYSADGPTYVITRSHNKGINWGSMVTGVLYKENETGIIEELGSTETIIGGYGWNFYALRGQVIWPEPDLVFMTTFHKGVHALVISPEDPLEPITIHRDSAPNLVGFVDKPANDFAVSIGWHKSVAPDISGQMLVGFIGGTGLHRYDVTYPEGVPDRDHRDRAIVFDNRKVFKCLDRIDINKMEVSDTGIVATATGRGLAIFPISAFDDLNFNCGTIWIDTTDWGYDEHHPEQFGPKIKNSLFVHLSFDTKNPDYLYVLNDGLWYLKISHSENRYIAEPLAYYPAHNTFGAQHDFGGQGMTFWNDPDIPIIQHPLAVVGDMSLDGGSAYISTWPGTIQRLELNSK